MSRDYKVYLEDILQAIQRILEYTAEIDFVYFKKDNKTFDAVVKNLEVIGEAAKQIPQTIRSKNADIEWAKITGMRDILVHEYFGIDIEIVWDIVRNKLPSLREQIQKLLVQV